MALIYSGTRDIAEAVTIYVINAEDRALGEYVFSVERISALFNAFRPAFHLIECAAIGEDYLHADFEGFEESKFGFNWQGERCYGNGFIIGVSEERLGLPRILNEPVEPLATINSKVSFWNN